jgi:hypothetical protein
VNPKSSSGLKACLPTVHATALGYRCEEAGSADFMNDSVYAHSGFRVHCTREIGTPMNPNRIAG